MGCFVNDLPFAILETEQSVNILSSHACNPEYMSVGLFSDGFSAPALAVAVNDAFLSHHIEPL